jgi:thioredoxin 2
MLPVFAKVGSMTEDILFAKVNTESQAQLSQSAGIRSLPTLIFFKQGKEIDRISGALSEAQLKQWIVKTVLSL